MRKSARLIALSFALAACDYSATTVYKQDPLVPSSIAISAPDTTPLTSAGDTRTLSVVVLNSAGRVIANPSVEWIWGPPGVVTVTNNTSGSLTVTAVGDGTALITARSGAIEGSTKIVVRRALASVSLETPLREVVLGTSTRLTAVALDARNNVIPNVQGFIFRSDNPTTLFAQPDGTVTGLFRFGQTAKATLTATVTRDGITASDTVGMAMIPPPSVDIGALLLTEFVVPLNPPTAGSGIAHFLRQGDRLNARIFWSLLTSRVTSVEIHGAARFDETADLLVNLGPLPASDSLGLVTMSITATDIRSQRGRAPITLDSLKSLMCNQLAYIDVRTTRFPNGEVRGQFTCLTP
ncbi:MAG: CHRD domain-containing protein [Phycisphaerae bacterium]|nr:CHRD domain-containing protein [Gemmatimonadaceae bacterium]